MLSEPDGYSTIKVPVPSDAETWARFYDAEGLVPLPIPPPRRQSPPAAMAAKTRRRRNAHTAILASLAAQGSLIFQTVAVGVILLFGDSDPIALALLIAPPLLLSAALLITSRRLGKKGDHHPQ